MKLSLRLLFLLIFLGFVLPKMLPFLGYRAAQNVEEQYQGIEKSYQKQVAEKRSKFASEVNRMGVRDAAFKRCILDELEIYTKMTPRSSGAIKSARQIKTLRCDGRGIRSLDGIDSFTQLQSLSLMRNNIRSLSSLRFHPSLKSIDLSDNNSIRTVEPLDTLGALTNISFPRMTRDECGVAKSIVETMKFNHGSGVRSNISYVCRG